ncbi:unnamed protein product, partial [Rotaria magnacalcarata]
ACSNPFFTHKKIITKSLRPLPKQIIESSDLQYGFNDSTLVCTACLSKINKQEESFTIAKPLINNDIYSLTSSPASSLSKFTSNEDSDLEVIIVDETCEDLNNTLKTLLVSPVKLHGLKSERKSKEGAKKLNQATLSLKRKLELSLETNIQNAAASEEKRRKTDSLERFDHLMLNLKNAFSETTSYQRKLQILTLSPFSISKTEEYFSASNYIVKKARKLKDEFGILPEIPKYTKGKKITIEMKSKVQQFYEDDDISRICPGKSDCLSIRDSDGKKVIMQKRLLLGNLKELYVKFKESSEYDDIGFSSFANLRPKWCVIAGGKGTHSVCVCIHHQNPKLMVSATGIKDLDYHTLIDKSVCDSKNPRCMLRQCRECPGKEGVASFLNSFSNLSDCESIIYNQWITTDRSNLETISNSVEDFIDILSAKITLLTRHHYIATSQSLYLKELKQNLKSDEIVLIGDFSENYSFVIQDEIQSFHWTNEQATVHPFVLYYKNDLGQTAHKSYCFISDCLIHTTVVVYTFQQELLKDIKQFLPHIKRVHYFSDGSAAQYKNRFNFINIVNHEKDFGLTCEWNFFATGHGKNACDGIGGTVKRGVAKASLQQIVSGHILTPKHFYDFSVNNFKGIQFFYISKLQINKMEISLSQRFSNALTIKGTQGFHKFAPILETNYIAAYQTSSSDDITKCKINKSQDVDDIAKSNESKTGKYQTGQYVACIYDLMFWVGIIEEVSTEFEDYRIRFLSQTDSKPNIYLFPTEEDQCWVIKKNMLCAFSTPEIIPGQRIKYLFASKEIKHAEVKFQNCN